MKRIGDLWPKVIAFDNLLLAWRKARRGKRRRAPVAVFGLGLEGELLALQAELEQGDWRPGPYRLFTVYERKPRLIAAAPFRDRVVHHALMNVIEPPLDRRFIYDCYACRQKKGVHVAVDRYQGWARRHAYILKMDVEKYFPSIDRQLLLDKLGARIKDLRVMALLKTVIDGAPSGESPLHWYPGDDLLTPLERPRGIPIGNLTSQFDEQGGLRAMGSDQSRRFLHRPPVVRQADSRLPRLDDHMTAVDLPVKGRRDASPVHHIHADRQVALDQRFPETQRAGVSSPSRSGLRSTRSRSLAACAAPVVRLP